MANGYASAIINDMAAAITAGKPSWRVDMQGFTKMLYTGSGATPIRVTDQATGGKRTFSYWYRTRVTTPMTDTAYSCDNVLTPARAETSVTAGNTRQIAWHLPDSLLTNYDKAGTSNAGLTPGVTPQVVSSEMVDIIYSGCNAILSGMNADLQGLLTWGKNAVTGSTSAPTINIATSATTISVNDGMPKLKSDTMRNGFQNRFNVVGLGTMYNYLQYKNYSTAPIDTGLDFRLATADFDFYADQTWVSASGAAASSADMVGLFDPGSIQIVEYLETDFRKGKLANSTFFQITLPTVDPAGNSVPVRFDAQLKEIDCPTTLTDAYSGSTATYNRGYSLILWKNFGLFQIPSTAFHATDPQYQNNGALRYTITNS